MTSTSLSLLRKIESEMTEQELDTWDNHITQLISDEHNSFMSILRLKTKVYNTNNIYFLNLLYVFIKENLDPQVQKLIMSDNDVDIAIELEDYKGIRHKHNYLNTEPLLMDILKLKDFKIQITPDKVSSISVPEFDFNINRNIGNMNMAIMKLIILFKLPDIVKLIYSNIKYRHILEMS